MIPRRHLLILGTLLTLAPVFLPAEASLGGDGNSPRQFYSGWRQIPRSNAHFRTYYYKPRPNFAGFKHHFVVHYPSHPRHLYFYNPYKKKFWGRCDAVGDGKPNYSRLPEESQKPTLAEIPESAFPASGGLPAIPESSDGAELDLPPDDLPPGVIAQGEAASKESEPAATPPAK